MKRKYPGLINTLLLSLLALVLFLVAVILFINVYIGHKTESLIYSDVSRVPEKKVALVLGTSKYSRIGKPNTFFYNRIEATVDLYSTGKIKHIIVSGDNAQPQYNEPRDMKNALVKRGIPASCITLDYAGFRTFDSVIRCRKIFGQTNITIISQKFHLQRALFIAQAIGIEAVGFVADPGNRESSFYHVSREVLAKCLAVLDLYVLDSEPKFLGEQITIAGCN